MPNIEPGACAAAAHPISDFPRTLQSDLVVHCANCSLPIGDPKRVLRGATTCSPECKKALDRKRRSLKDVRTCRLCGRGRPKGKVAVERQLRRDAVQLLRHLVSVIESQVGFESPLRTGEAVEAARRVIDAADILEVDLAIAAERIQDAPDA